MPACVCSIDCVALTGFSGPRRVWECIGYNGARRPACRVSYSDPPHAFLAGAPQPRPPPALTPRLARAASSRGKESRASGFSNYSKAAKGLSWSNFETHSSCRPFSLAPPRGPRPLCVRSSWQLFSLLPVSCCASCGSCCSPPADPASPAGGRPRSFALGARSTTRRATSAPSAGRAACRGTAPRTGTSQGRAGPRHAGSSRPRTTNIQNQTLPSTPTPSPPPSRVYVSLELRPGFFCCAGLAFSGLPPPSLRGVRGPEVRGMLQ